MMKRHINDWVGNIVALGLVLLVNGLANALPIGGRTTGQVSANYESLFTPAGFTFAIWGLIYAGLIVFVVYQALPAKRENVALSRIHKMFKVNCLANALWILAWHYDLIVISLLLMLVILFSLMRIYHSLGIANGPASLSRKICVHLPFSLYTGWITIATIANISALQSGLGWNELGLDAVNWTLLKLALAGAITATVVLRRGDLAFGLVAVWASYGIVVKQVENTAVSSAADVVAMVAFFLVLTEAIRKLRS